MHNVDTSGGVVFRLRKERLGMETVAPSLGSQLMWMLILVVAVVMGAGFYRVKHRDGNTSAPSSSKKAKTCAPNNSWVTKAGIMRLLFSKIGCISTGRRNGMRWQEMRMLMM